MSQLCIWDTETNGLLKEATVMHCVGAFIDGQWYHGHSGHRGDAYYKDMVLPSGKILHRVLHTSVEAVLKEVAKARIRVAHNGQDFDDRVTCKLFPWWDPEGECLDTMHLSRLLYPTIGADGPNTHKCPPNMRMRHSVEAWGYRLGERKNKDYDPTGGGLYEAWSTWSWDQSLYMMQDIVSLERIFKFLMSQKPSQAAMRNEHDFAAIIRRQEAWGFTFDRDKAITLAADLGDRLQELEASLVETFGEWWAPGKIKRVSKTRRVKVQGHPDVTQPRYGVNGKRLPKDYVGPPLCLYEEGAVYQEIERVEFKPGSRDHVKLMLEKRYGWRPQKWTPKGAPAIDDDVLRSLPYPEAPMLADYYAADKIRGYVSKGAQAWMSCAVEEDDAWRVHGRVNTIGTYTFRCSHSKPNLGQVPTRDPTFGHRCRELFTNRKGFILAGFDGSGLQLRLLAHYMATWDKGEYARIVSQEDPHVYMRDICMSAAREADLEVTILDPQDERPGRAQGKTGNYALVFGGGAPKLGSIWVPLGSEPDQKRLGQAIVAALTERLWAWAKLKEALKYRVEETGHLIGLDGRRIPVHKAFAALASLLQAAEGVVMKVALVILDGWLQDAGLRPGVTRTGLAIPSEADYEFCVNVHDEAQADIRPQHRELFQRLAEAAVTEAGVRLGLKCPLKSDVKFGTMWVETH